MADIYTLRLTLMYIGKYVHTYICSRAFGIWTVAHIYIHTYIYTCYIHTDTYIHIYIHTYTHM